MDYYISIACSDSSCGAGIEQDQKVFNHFKVWGLSAITGFSIQDFHKVKKVKSIDTDFLDQCLSHLLDNFPVKGIKIGLIPHQSLIPVIIKHLTKFKGTVVLDPVFQSSSGTKFLGDDDIDYLKKYLLPYVDIVCPNKLELELLCKQNIQTLEEAIRIISECFDSNLSFYLKGGHFEHELIHEVFITKSSIYHFDFKRKSWKYSHGTGCAFSTALCVKLSQTEDIIQAVNNSHHYVATYYDNMNQMMFNDQFQ